MSFLKLSFVSRSDEISLSSTTFRLETGGPEIRSIRSTAVLSGAGTFQWTAAVKALSLFFLQAKRERTLAGPCLEGEAGSAAASLDYALSKEPSWMSDIFGSDEEGRPCLHSFIRRVNPNRKRPGPVQLYLTSRRLSPDSIAVFLDGSEVHAEGVTKISESVELQLRNEKKFGRGRPSSSRETVDIRRSPWTLLRAALPAYPALASAIGRRERIGDQSGWLFPNLQESYLQWASEEILCELSRSENFSKDSHADSLCRIAELEDYRRIVGSDVRALESIGPLSEMERHGMSNSTESAQSVPPTAVRLTCESIGCAALFVYLSELEGLPFHLDFPFERTADTVHAMLNGDRERAGDLCSINIASAAQYFKNARRAKREYVPLLFSPKGTIRALVSERSKEQRLVVSKDLQRSDSILGFYLRSLSPRQVVISNSESPSLISWFPYTQLITTIHGARLLTPRRPTGSCPDFRIDNILFCHRELALDARRLRELCVQLRHAWLSLRESSRLRDLVAALLVTDNRYMTLLRRRMEFSEHEEAKLAASSGSRGRDERSKTPISNLPPRPLC